MKRIKVPNALKEIARTFLEKGFQVFLVGGAVRDFYLGKPCVDFDIATNAHPEQVRAMFKKIIPTGIKHGTVTILNKDLAVECTTFRSDGKYTDSRHPDEVSFDVTIDEDLSRRDFTINALAISLEDYSVLDKFSGLEDLKREVIRAVGNPLERFTEDPLRMLRGIRFASQLNFKIETATLDAIKTLAEKINTISKERIRDEISKMLVSENPLIGLNLLFETGLLKFIIPELNTCAGIEQGEFHFADVLQHSFAVCSNTPKDLVLRLAGLLHDVGKQNTKTVDEDTGAIHFYRHEVESEKLTKSILRKLKFPNTIVDKVVVLVRHHMFQYTSNWKDNAIRRFIVRVSPENIQALLQLRIADIRGLKANCLDISHIVELENRINAIMEADHCFSLKDLQITGSDLIGIGVPAGKEIGLILNELLQVVIDDPSQNNYETLLRISEKLHEKYSQA